MGTLWPCLSRMPLCHPLQDPEDLKRTISGKLDWQGNAFLPVLCPLVQLAVFLCHSKVTQNISKRPRFISPNTQ